MRTRLGGICWMACLARWEANALRLYVQNEHSPWVIRTEKRMDNTCI